MKKIFLLLFPFSFLFLCVQCGDDDMKDPCDKYYKAMPEATMTGKNTFGCLINGEDWVPYTDPVSQAFGGAVQFDLDFNESLKSVSILSKRKIEEPNCDTLNQTFILDIFNLDKNNSNKFISGSEYLDRSGNCFYKIDTISKNEIIVLKLDTLQGIISCIFEMTFISEGCSDTLRITEGRFDSSYR